MKRLIYLLPILFFGCATQYQSAYKHLLIDEAYIRIHRKVNIIGKIEANYYTNKLQIDRENIIYSDIKHARVNGNNDTTWIYYNRYIPINSEHLYKYKQTKKGKKYYINNKRPYIVQQLP